MGEFNVFENQLNYQFLLLVHMVCADGQLHSEELKHLENLAQKYQIGQSTRDEMNKIIKGDDRDISVGFLADRIDKDKHQETMRQMMVVGYAYGSFSPSKEKIIDRVANCWNWSSDYRNKLLEEARKLADLAINYKQHKKASETTKIQGDRQEKDNSANSDKKDRKISNQKENLLDEVEYKEAIEQCSKIAKEDYQYTEIAALQRTRSTLDNLANNLQQAIRRADLAKGEGAEIKYRSRNKGKANSAKEVAQQLENSRKDLDAQITKDIEEVEKSLDAKKRATKCFTIGFMGKTKAGKSTLHAVITQGGWDAIGLGKQRTTRENREYKWKNIRIIDTPGIGAPGGKTDEEIAESIIEESDVICYVVTNDSIPEKDFQFLKLLKEKTKPLIVLLNIKYNLRDSRRLEHFLKQPNKLFAKDGKSGIGGHFDRIRRYAKEYYANDYFPIVPVMLLAAQLSSEPEHQDNKDKLYKASRIQDFLDSIRESIIKHGSIRRSQTFLGSTVGNIQEFDNWISKQLTAYQNSANTLRNKRQKVSREIEQAKQDSWEYLEQEIEAIFQSAFEIVQPFAEEYWNKNEILLKNGWQQQVNNINFESRLKNAFKQAADKFAKEVQEILEEVGKELEFSFRFNSDDFHFNQQDSFDFKNFWRISGSILGVIGAIVFIFAPPVGIVTGIAGGVISFLGGFLEDRNTKRRKAVKNISDSLNSQLEEQKKNELKEANKNWQKACDDCAKDIDRYFDELIEGLNAIATQLETAKEKLDNTIDYLNCGYGKRIVDWSCEKYEPLNVKNVKKTIVKVERKFGHWIKIHTNSKLNIKISEAE
ncbi:MAG: 50S ribosome-binding GTPase, partial [Prochloraceae cyanobacterium]|nr:50S ribosome-binding GTPase [Prochloraceae cyanobacterium]